MEYRELCFMHIPKTGGCAIIETLDLPNCGYDMSLNEPYNNVIILSREPSLVRAKYIKPDLNIAIVRHNSRNPNYMTLAKYKSERNPHCFAFAFVRNPYDRVISAFAFLCGKGLTVGDKSDAERYVAPYQGDFEAFIEGSFNHAYPEIFSQMHFRPQSEWVCDSKGRLLLDFIGRFERLQDDLDHVKRMFGLPCEAIQHINRSNRKKYDSSYSPRTRELIAHAYKRDFELFGYERCQNSR